MFIFAFIKKISFSVKKYNIKKGTENEGNPTRNKHFGMAQSQLTPNQTRLPDYPPLEGGVAPGGDII